MSIHSDMEIIMSDMSSSGDSPYGDIIKKNQENSYYNGFGAHLSCQIKNKEQYFNLLMGILINFDELDGSQKESIQIKMGIYPKTIIKEKVVYKTKNIPQKNTKPKLNMNYDDY